MAGGRERKGKVGMFKHFLGSVFVCIILCSLGDFFPVFLNNLLFFSFCPVYLSCTTTLYIFSDLLGIQQKYLPF